MNRRALFVVALLAILAGALPATAQTTTSGSVRGVVSDPTGGVLPGA